MANKDAGTKAPTTLSQRKDLKGNFLNFRGEHAGTFIYRIVSQDRLFELFDGQQNALVHPSKWDDPFENLILNAKIKMPGGDTGDFGFRNDLYGQCWTLHQASDAMWRIYSPNKLGVRVRTTIGRLAGSLSNCLGDWARQQCFVGKVQYMTTPQMRSFGETFAAGHLSADAVARTLLVKREAFKHEREVRLIYFEKDNTRHAEGVFRYALDPHKMIDQLMVDPRVPLDEFVSLKREIKYRTSFRKSIERSTLYDPPTQLVLRFGSQD